MKYNKIGQSKFQTYLKLVFWQKKSSHVLWYKLYNRLPNFDNYNPETNFINLWTGKRRTGIVDRAFKVFHLEI